MVNQDLPWRKISKDKYIIAGVITLLIFSLGISLGFIFENQRYALLGDINQEQEVKYLSLQLQYLYLNYFSSYNNCPTLTTTLKETIKDLSDSLSEVIAFEEQNKVSSSQHQVVQRRYVLDNLRYWLLAKESKQKCDMNIVPILYFYTQECSSCPNQGTVLSYFKSVFGEQVLVFPINLDLRQEEPMVEIAISQFNITKYPTIVVDNTKYEGVVKEDQLKEIICASLKQSPECS
ncbi:MAG: hypothetical protein QT02_C0011G0031 [archaeon GW2011_AR9]|nr:MAG: hypothetical protein QT02_C0011G0031 [archaeon GW2011_AR9]HIG93368.1 hypothetical protein [Candidatus Woesearchaeota archaeon]